MLLLGGGLRYDDCPCYILVEVTSNEMLTMKRKRMDWDRMVSYLGLNYDDPAVEAA